MIDNELVTLDRALKQIERNCYIVDKVTKQKVPDAKQVKLYVSELFHVMEESDWKKLAEAYNGIMFPKKTYKKRGRPRTEKYGMSGGARNQLEQQQAEELGVWHIRFPHGCTDCGSKAYRHASGGLCNRCVSILREIGMSINEYRRFVKDKESGNV